MVTNLNPTMQQFLDNLNNISTAMQTAQQQVSTGLKVSSVSDAPDSISLILAAHANLSTTEQTLTNLGRTTTEVNAGEQALESAVQLFDSAQTLATQGATDTLPASGRADLAQQVNSLLQQMVGLAGTTVEGRYIFSGDSDQQAPYTYTAGQANPVSAYQGSASTRLAQDPNGSTFPVALTAQQIFDSSDPTTNVFQSLESLSAALTSNDTAAIQNVVNGMPKVAQYLNSQLAFYGTTQDRVASATTNGQTLQTQLQTQISSLQDADLTQSILDLTQAQTQQQAALQSEAQLPRTTLFDFLA